MRIFTRQQSRAEIIPIEGKTYHFDPPEPRHDPVRYKFTEDQIKDIDRRCKRNRTKWCLATLLLGILIGASGMFCYNYRRVYDSGYVHATKDFKKQVSDLVERYHNTLSP